MECLETNKVCTNINKKCKVCMLDDCKKTFKIIELQEKKEKEENIKRIETKLPETCKRCSFLEIVDKKIVKCFYRVKGKCILNERNNSIKSNK